MSVKVLLARTLLARSDSTILLTGVVETFAAESFHHGIAGKCRTCVRAEQRGASA